MNIDRLMTKDGMREFTARCRDRHQKGGEQYQQLGEIVQRRLQQERIAGDRFYSARIRAWKVKRQLRKLARLSRKAAATAEAVNSSYNRNVLDVPRQRAEIAAGKAQRKQNRIAATSDFVDKSLTKSAEAFSGASPQVTDPYEQPATYLEPDPTPMQMAAGDGVRSSGTIYDHFPKGGHR